MLTTKRKWKVCVCRNATPYFQQENIYQENVISWLHYTPLVYTESTSTRNRGVLYQIPEQGVLANLSTNFALPLWGGEGSVPVKTQSAKICLNFNFFGGEGSIPVKTQSAKICPNFNFLFLPIWAQILPCQFGGGRVLYQSKLKVPRSA